MMISVITPVYGCRRCLHELHTRLTNTLSSITDKYEIIMVNDSSPDGAWDTIKELSQKDSNTKGINLSRNFGQHYAITAGLDFAKGDWIVVMDCDLQENPEDISLFYEEIKKGYDIVLGRRTHRKDNFFKKFGSFLFNYIFNKLSDFKRDPDVAFYVMFSKTVCKSLCSMREHARFMPSLLDWTGFKKSYINISHNERYDGKSGYSLKKLLKLAFDAILSHSNKPLRIIIGYGFFISILSLIYLLYIFVLYFVRGVQATGWTSLIISLWFLSGNIIVTLGVIGIYISRIYDEAKGRPLYLVKETTF